MKHPCLLPSLFVFALSCAALRGQDGMPIELQNSTFTTPDSSGLPSGWKAFPPPNGSGTVIEVLDAGGTKFVDADSGEGLGLAQWVPAVSGKQYRATLSAEGTGGCFVYLVFASKVPVRDSDLKQTKVGEQRQWVAGSKGGGTVTAKAGSDHLMVWIYSPKDNANCELVLKSITLEELAESASAAPEASAADQAGLLNTIDFETGDFAQVASQEGGQHSVVTDPVRRGRHAMKANILHSQKRSEITGSRSEPYGEVKYGWSIFIPEEFDGATSFSVVSQWHDWGSGKNYVPDGGPPTHLYISKDNWRFKLRHQDGATDRTAKIEHDLGPIAPDRGRWTDFVMEVNWQSPQTGGGYLRLYKNGGKVIDYEGPTWYDDKTKGPFFKMGIYKGGSKSWKGEESGAVLYFDEFRMAGGDASRDAVDPAKQIQLTGN